MTEQQIREACELLCGGDNSHRIYIYGGLSRIGWTASEHGWVNSEELATIILKQTKGE